MFKKSIIVSGSIFALALATAVYAQTTAPVAPTTGATINPAIAKIACVGAAVNTREAAIVAGIGVQTQSLNAAHIARAGALKQAYTLTTLKAVNAAVRTAWSTYNSSVRSARKTWQAARDSAWKQYRTTAVACRAPAGTGDGANSDSEPSGN